jgi:hypothetical protein
MEFIELISSLILIILGLILIVLEPIFYLVHSLIYWNEKSIEKRKRKQAANTTNLHDRKTCKRCREIESAGYGPKPRDKSKTEVTAGRAPRNKG